MSEQEKMSAERFRALAEAYGGSIERWPEESRHAATRLLANPEYAGVLEAARTLDDALDAWKVMPPAPALSLRVSAGASISIVEYMARWRLWLSGIGLAAALAGALAGSVAVATLTPTDSGWLPMSTAFGDLSE